MRFTEREMTVAVEAVARGGFEALPGLLRRRLGAATWDDLPRAARYQHLTAAGDLVLAALVALPERPTVGATPGFTDAEYAEAVTSTLGADTDGGRTARRRQQAGEVALRRAVAAMPPRQDPDALIVPDDLGGL